MVDAGHAKVEHFDEVWVVTALHEHDIFRLQIAMHDTTLMRDAHCVGDLQHDVERARLR